MLDLFAQATQPTGPATWSVTEWCALISAIVGGVVLIINTWHSRSAAIDSRQILTNQQALHPEIPQTPAKPNP